MTQENLNLIIENFNVLTDAVNENPRALRDPAITSALGVVSGVLKTLYELGGGQQDTEKTIKGFGG